MMEATTLAEMNIQIVPFVSRVKECAKCEHKHYRGPYFVIRWLDLPMATFDLTYCPGSLEPTHKSTHMIMGEEGPEMHEHEVPVACASLRTDHFHLKCNECGYRWIMMAREK